jgi:hypothetical protein
MHHNSAIRFPFGGKKPYGTMPIPQTCLACFMLIKTGVSKAGNSGLQIPLLQFAVFVFFYTRQERNSWLMPPMY